MTSFEQKLFLKYLELVSSGALTSVTIPEMARMVLRRKRVVRFFCEPGEEQLSEVLDLMPAVGRRMVASEHIGGTWASIHAIDRVDQSPENFCLGELIVIGYDQVLVEEVLAAETESTQIAGAVLDYPQCCAAACDSFAQAGQYWPAELVRKSIDTHAIAQANRLPADWGGLSPVGEMFPCSLSCNSAAFIGNDGVDSLRTLGFSRLADHIINDATTAFIIDECGRARPAISGANGRRLEWQGRSHASN